MSRGQDYYAGSGFEISKMTTLSVDEEGTQQRAAILAQADALLRDLCPPEPPAPEEHPALGSEASRQSSQPPLPRVVS